MIRVFIVDDEEVILAGIRNAILHLPGNKYQICGEASDGETAWPMILECKPDVVLADVRMPFMNGLELAKIVKKTLPATKFIIISGHDEFEYAQEAVSIGVDSYVLKPINSRKIMDILESMEESKAQKPERLLMQFSDEQEAKSDTTGEMVSSHDLAVLETRLRYAKEEDLEEIYQTYFHTERDDSAESVLLRYYLLMNLIMVVDTLLKHMGERGEGMSAVSLLSVAGSWDAMRELAMRYMTIYVHKRDAAEDSGNSKEITRAKQYIDAHFSESEISLNKVAQIAGFSASYFSTLFAQEVGVSFVEYLTSCRMEKAKMLIGEGDARLHNLAEQVGYSDPYYFSQVFKKHFKVSPKEFQCQLKKQ